MRAWLIIASPLDSAGTASEQRFSQGFERPSHLSAKERVIRLPTISVDALPSGIGLGGSSSGVGSLVLANTDDALDDLHDLNWEDADIELYRGDPSDTDTASLTLVAKMRSESISESAGRAITIAMKDRSSALDVPVELPRYDGTGDEEGPAELEGKVKPVAFGYQFAVTPIEVDRASLTYQVHCREIDQIRYTESDPTLAAGVTDKGVTLTNAGDIETLSGSGAGYAELTAYDLSDAAYAGQYITWLAGGMIRLAREPVGLLTVDFDGDAEGGFISLPGDIIQRILSDFWDGSGVTADTTSLDQLDVDFPYPVKLYIDAEGPRVSDLIESLVSAAGGMWWVDALGNLKAQIFDFSATPTVIDDYQRSEKTRGAAWPRVNPLIVGHSLVTTVHSASDLAALPTAGVAPPYARYGEGATTIEFVANYTVAGSSNTGEIACYAGFWRSPDGSTRTLSADTNLWTRYEGENKPTDGIFYVIWGQEDTSTRFPDFSSGWGGAGDEGIFTAEYERTTGRWYTVDNSASSDPEEFTLLDTDIIFAVGTKLSEVSGSGIETLRCVVPKIEGFTAPETLSTSVVKEENNTARTIAAGAGGDYFYDGDTFTFLYSWADTPNLGFDGGGLSYKASVSSADQQIVPRIESLTTSGGTISARLKGLAGTTNPIVETTTSTGSGSDPDIIIEKTETDEAGNDNYTFSVTVNAEDCVINEAEYFWGYVRVGFYTRTTSGGAWTQRSTFTYSSSGTFTLTVNVDGLGQNAAFGVTEEATSICSSNGLTSFNSVSYDTAATASDNSATPTGAEPLWLRIIGGIDPL